MSISASGIWEYFVIHLCSSVHSRVEALCQTSYSPNNYTLSWEVRNTSFVSIFRVYHEGVLQGTTSFTNYTVVGLLPCQQYEARVEALCGDGVVMNVQTVTAHTGKVATQLNHLITWQWSLKMFWTIFPISPTHIPALTFMVLSSSVDSKDRLIGSWFYPKKL